MLAFIKQSGVKSYVDGNTSYFFDEHILNDFNPGMFEQSYWREQNAILGEACGRGVTYFIDHANSPLVLRHYYRGGLIAKLINDSYLFNGIDNTRPAREAAILAQMQAWQLPAPKPVAFRVQKRFGFYQADILISLIPGAKDLVGILSEHGLTDEIWRDIGATIRHFHDKDIYHHDLNAHNIMLDEDNKVWLIDFDRAEVKGNGEWKRENIDRLLRSFRKELGLIDGFHFSEEQFDLLLEGYRQH